MKTLVLAVMLAAATASVGFAVTQVAAAKPTPTPCCPR
jgi:hypothetical protein